MPWTTRDYPVSWKNLDPLTRKKAIDIANAMIADGYEEDAAIPIALTAAKRWMKNATPDELTDLASMRLIQHRRKGGLSGARLMDDNVVVRYDGEKEQWEVISETARQADSLHATKAAAITRAREIAGNRGTKVITRKKGE